MNDPIPTIETKELTIAFGGHIAVNSVSTSFHQGTLTGIVGPNGAGKTTYFNLISGQYKASAGELYYRGKNIINYSVAHRSQMGIGRSFQLTNLFPKLSVLENVRLAVQGKRGGGYRFFNLIGRDKTLKNETMSFLEKVEMQHMASTEVSALTHGDQRKLEVAILLALEPDVFMFDEPTAGMSLDEAPIILELIKKIKQDESKTILLVEHKMDVIRELTDRIIVLNNGQLVADGEPAEVMNAPMVKEAYLGVSE